MSPKSWSVKTLMTKLAAILLKELPVAFEGLVFLRFSVELVHDLDADAVHSPAEVLDHVKTIQNDLGMREKLLGQLIVRTEHIHGHHFDPPTNLFRIA